MDPMIAQVVRWTARLSSLAVIAFILMMAFGEPGRPSRSEIVGMTFFPGLLCIGFLLAWWREDVGAVIATIGLAGFYVWYLSARGQLPRGPWFLVLWLPTLLFVASLLLRRKPA
jgi:fucose 4-O-acetylase-like acetyltransferase